MSSSLTGRANFRPVNQAFGAIRDVQAPGQRVVLDRFLDHADFGETATAGTIIEEPAMLEQVASTEKEAPPLWTQVLDGIYKNRDSGMLHERPILLSGIRTWPEAGLRPDERDL